MSAIDVEIKKTGRSATSRREKCSDYLEVGETHFECPNIVGIFGN